MAAHGQIERLVAELLAEDTLAGDAEAAAAIAEAAATSLGELEAVRDRAVDDELARLVEVLDSLAKAVEVEERLAAGITAAWEELQPTLASTFGGGLEAWEDLLDALAGRHVPGVLHSGVTHAERMSDRTIYALQRARGQRRRPFNDESATAEHPAGDDQWVLRPSAEAAIEEADPTKVRKVVARAHRVARSRPTVDDPDVAYAWSLVSSLIPMADSSVAPFGEITDATAVAWTKAASRPDSGARSLALATKASSKHLIDGRRWANPLQPPPLFPRPSDAAVLRWWYRQAALASGVLIDEFSVRPGTPEAERDLALFVECVELLDGAALYWLPPGQTASFLDSQPLASADRDDLRLPYGRTLVIPADPIRLHPTDVPPANDADADDPHEILMEAARAAMHVSKVATSRAQTPREARNSSSSIYLGDALRLRGALVEGVLFEADRAGRRTDRVIWCVALPTGDDTAVFGRVAIPALASQSTWADVLDQLAAVAAWGEWAEVEDDLDGAANDHADGAKSKRAATITAGWLQVLDVGRTESEPSASEPTGRKVSPHTRRGHWRRQHTGPGGEVIKRVRIAPTVVNASLGPLAPRVYRLPAPAPPRQGDASADPKGAFAE